MRKLAAQVRPFRSLKHPAYRTKQVSNKPGTFTKGDPRINRKGRPRSCDALRELAQQIAHEAATSKTGEQIVLSGEPPNPARRPAGCAFHPRCPLARAECRVTTPELRPVGAQRRVACHVVKAEVLPFGEVA
jgi:oligopeptide/dipeptide ABC transporter ATP-binding protein